MKQNKLAFMLFGLLLVLAPINCDSDEEGAMAECFLGARVYPLKYVGATQTVEFRLGFKSNCSDFESHNFFILPYDQDFKLTQHTHPTTVVLQISGNVFEFEFSEPHKKGKTRYMNILYKKVELKPGSSLGKINTFDTNNVLFRKASVTMFSKEFIDKLYYNQNPCLCQVSKTKKSLMCNID